MKLHIFKKVTNSLKISVCIFLLPEPCRLFIVQVTQIHEFRSWELLRTFLYLFSFKECQTDLQFTFVKSVLCRSRKNASYTMASALRSSDQTSLTAYTSTEVINFYHNFTLKKPNIKCILLPVQRRTVIGSVLQSFLQTTHWLLSGYLY